MLLGEIFGDFLKAEGLETGIKRMEVFDAWDKAVGSRMAEYTTEKFFKEGKLYCKISSSAARTQLFMIRIQLVEKINQILSSEVVKEIIFK